MIDTEGGDYSVGGNAHLATPIQRGAVQATAEGNPGTSLDPNLSALTAVLQSNQGGTEDLQGTIEATQGQIGTVFGTATLPSQDGINGYVLTSAFTKRHTRIGPGGPGAIYLTSIAGDPNGTLFVTIPNAGDPRPSNADPAYDWFHDPEVNAEVETTGLGGW